MKDVISEIKKLRENSPVAYVGSVNEAGFPQIKGMLVFEHSGMKTQYFSTNTSSKRVGQFRKNPKACVYYCDETKSLFSIFLRTSFRQSFAADCVKKPCNTASITAAFFLVIDKILPKTRTPKDTEQALRTNTRARFLRGLLRSAQTARPRLCCGGTAARYTTQKAWTTRITACTNSPPRR